MQWNFGDFLLAMIALFFWTAFIWMFIAIFADIFRREDLTGWAKAGWALLIVILPFVGILIYLAARPKMTAQDRRMMEQQDYGAVDYGAGVSGYSASDEIAKAARLQQQGAITPDEYERLKREALTHQAAT